MDITKETIKINKIICEKKEQIVVQGDMIVPLKARYIKYN